MIPQLRQGGIDIFGVAVAVSKLDGTGLENEQIVHTHVALLGLGVLRPDPALGKGLLPPYIGDALGLRDGEPATCELEKVDGLRFEMSDGFAAFGYRVILADDLRKPACNSSARCRNLNIYVLYYVELISFNILQFHSNRMLPRLQIIDVAYPMTGQVCMAILMIW